MNLRVILGLNPCLAEDLVRNTFPLQALDDLLHSIQLQHRRVGHDKNFLRSQMSEIHSNLFRATRSKTDGRCGHFECIFFLLAQVDWGRQRSYAASIRVLNVVVVMVARIGMARTSTVGGVDGTEEIEGSGSPRGRDSGDSHD